jgi:hypothetical protein
MNGGSNTLMKGCVTVVVKHNRMIAKDKGNAVRNR